MATPKIAGGIDAIVHKIDCGGDIKIKPLSDLHIGDPHADMELIRQLVDDIKNDENTYTLLAGDLMNSAIAGSKSDSYSETMTPQEELDACFELFYPVKEKILAVVPGNHEERISKSVGMDVTKILCDRLGISDRYRPESALMIIQFGRKKNNKQKRMAYSFFVNHGHGGGRRISGKLNGLSDLADIIDADVIVQGHTHQSGLLRRLQYKIYMQSHVATPHEQVLVNLPSALRYGGYGMRNAYQPASNHFPEIILSDLEHKIDVKM